MTHFNHDWTDDTVAVPQAVGDRYYAQDLNDDFNYLKHLPYEAILQGRTKGVIIPPIDTWDIDSHSLTLSGGFGVVALDTPVLDINEDFTIPPKTILVPRFERIAFSNATLILPNDANAHYIVATPTKRSLLQRGKALLSENYACRVKYDGVITIQDTAPTTNQILIGLCHNNEYLLCKDFVFDQGIDTIKLHKWYGENKITNSLVSLLQSYYNINISTIETSISINNVDGSIVGTTVEGIVGGTFNNCTISIGSIKKSFNITTRGIVGGTFNNCTISIGIVKNTGIKDSIFNNCDIYIGNIDGGNFSDGIRGSTLNNCTISIGSIIWGYGISVGTFNNCIINIRTIDVGAGINGSTLNNCIIYIETINVVDGARKGINGGTLNNCTISVKTDSGNNSIANIDVVEMYFVHAILPSVPTLSSVTGKGFVVNNTTIKGL